MLFENASVASFVSFLIFVMVILAGVWLAFIGLTAKRWLRVTEARVQANSDRPKLAIYADYFAASVGLIGLIFVSPVDDQVNFVICIMLLLVGVTGYLQSKKPSRFFLSGINPWHLKIACICASAILIYAGIQYVQGAHYKIVAVDAETGQVIGEWRKIDGEWIKVSGEEK